MIQSCTHNKLYWNSSVGDLAFNWNTPLNTFLTWSLIVHPVIIITTTAILQLNDSNHLNLRVNFRLPIKKKKFQRGIILCSLHVWNLAHADYFSPLNWSSIKNIVHLISLYKIYIEIKDTRIHALAD